MQTAFFWIMWGTISAWTLRTFYYSTSKKKLEQLRKTAIGINLAVLVSTFLPWLPPRFGGDSGLMLVFGGNVLALLFVMLLAASIVLFLVKEKTLLKIASVTTITNTFLLFAIMYQLRPKTFELTFYDIAPIVAALFLLIGDVVVLLLWQQLQLLKRKGRKKQKS